MKLIHKLNMYLWLFLIVIHVTPEDVEAAEQRNDPYSPWVKAIAKFNIKLW